MAVTTFPTRARRSPCRDLGFGFRRLVSRLPVGDTTDVGSQRLAVGRGRAVVVDALPFGASRRETGVAKRFYGAIAGGGSGSDGDGTVAGLAIFPEGRRDAASGAGVVWRRHFVFCGDNWTPTFCESFRDRLCGVL